MYVWDESLRTGEATIDEQHKNLFSAINSLIQTIEQGKSGDELKKSLDFLNDYTITHFYEEEQIQKKYQYPDYPNHRELHEGLKKVVRDLQVQFIMKGPSEELAQSIQIKVGDWLVTHIKSQDVKIGAHLRSKGVV